MDVDNIIYCKNTGTPFRIRRLCFLNSIKHFELEDVSSLSNRKLLSEASVKVAFNIEKNKKDKGKIARFTELLTG